jgi:hypothetical protein
MATIRDASVLLEDASYLFNGKQHVLSMTVTLLNKARTKEAKVKKSNKEQVYIYCATNMKKVEGGCMYGINAKFVSAGCTITSKNLSHTCIGHYVPTDKRSN